jgi:hypothetical protein
VPEARKLGPIHVYDDTGLAQQRAEWKLARWLNGERFDDPVGRNKRYLLSAFVGGLVLTGYVTASFIEWGFVLPLAVVSLVPLYVLVSALRNFTRSSAESPQDCVREFVNCVNRGMRRRAWRLLTPLDRDNYTRAAPSAGEHDPASVKRFAFDSRGAFAGYWRAARALGPATRLALVATPELLFMTPDIAVVGVQIHVQRTMRMQRNTLAFVLRKLVLRYGNEWRIFDGEVLSAAEMDVNWVNNVLLAHKSQE